MDPVHQRTSDRISTLPETILLRMLSFLPTKITVQTSILSRRWRYLWRHVANLEFEYHSLEHSPAHRVEHRARFAYFVRSVLALNNSPSIKKFKLTCDDHCETFVSTLIHWAIEHRVQELIVSLLMIKVQEPVKLPCIVFTSETLVHLELSSGIVLDVPISVCLPILKILRLFSIKYTSDDTVKKLLSGCPVLEELIVMRLLPDNVLDFNISSPSLKRLILDYDETELDNHEDKLDYKLIINAPNLSYLKLNDVLSQDYFVDDLSSLDEVYIDIRPMRDVLEQSKFQDAINKLLIGVSNVKHLSFACETSYTISNIDGDKRPTFSNVTHLEFSLLKDNYGWRMLTDFLESSPNLEVLIIPEVYYTGTVDPEYWTPPQHVLTCLESHLIEIEIKQMFANPYMLQMIGFMLRSSKFLKKMTIDLEDTQDIDFEKEHWFFKELARFPRGSSRCELKLLFEAERGHLNPDL